MDAAPAGGGRREGLRCGDYARRSAANVQRGCPPYAGVPPTLAVKHPVVTGQRRQSTSEVGRIELRIEPLKERIDRVWGWCEIHPLHFDIAARRGRYIIAQVGSLDQRLLSVWGCDAIIHVGIGSVPKGVIRPAERQRPAPIVADHPAQESHLSATPANPVTAVR